MISSLNLLKPISRRERTIAEKCGRIKKDEIVPMYKNILDGIQTSPRQFADIPDKTVKIGTKLSPNNVEVLEVIMNDKRLANNKFIRTNLTEILDMASTKEGLNILKEILTPETLSKIDNQRRLVQKNPRNYINDKDNSKYLRTPAALNALFHDINILKAAYVMKPKALNSLFKMDITSEVGKDFLRFIGDMNLEEMNRFKCHWSDAELI